MSVGVKDEVARAVARGQGGEGRAFCGCEFSGCVVEAVDVDSVLREVSGQYELVTGIGGDHVRVRVVVPADGKTASRCIGGVAGTESVLVAMDIDGGAQWAVRLGG